MRKKFFIFAMALVMCLPICGLSAGCETKSDVEEESKLVGVEIDSKEAKTEFAVGDTFDATGLKVYAVYEETKVLVDSGYTFNFSEANLDEDKVFTQASGEKSGYKIYVTYKNKLGDEKTGSYIVKVNEGEPITSQPVTTNKICVGQELSDGVEFIVGKEDVLSECKCTDFDNKTVGEQNVKIKYRDFEYTVTVEVLSEKAYFDYVIEKCNDAKVKNVVISDGSIKKYVDNDKVYKEMTGFQSWTVNEADGIVRYEINGDIPTKFEGVKDRDGVKTFIQNIKKNYAKDKVEYKASVENGTFVMTLKNDSDVDVEIYIDRDNWQILGYNDKKTGKTVTISYDNDSYSVPEIPEDTNWYLSGNSTGIDFTQNGWQTILQEKVTAGMENYSNLTLKTTETDSKGKVTNTLIQKDASTQYAERTEAYKAWAVGTDFYKFVDGSLYYDNYETVNDLLKNYDAVYSFDKYSYVSYSEQNHELVVERKDDGTSLYTGTVVIDTTNWRIVSCKLSIYSLDDWSVELEDGTSNIIYKYTDEETVIGTLVIDMNTWEIISKDVSDEKLLGNKDSLNYVYTYDNEMFAIPEIPFKNDDFITKAKNAVKNAPNFSLADGEDKVIANSTTIYFSDANLWYVLNDGVVNAIVAKGDYCHVEQIDKNVPDNMKEYLFKQKITDNLSSEYSWICDIDEKLLTIIDKSGDTTVEISTDNWEIKEVVTSVVSIDGDIEITTIKVSYDETAMKVAPTLPKVDLTDFGGYVCNKVTEKLTNTEKISWVDENGKIRVASANVEYNVTDKEWCVKTESGINTISSKNNKYYLESEEKNVGDMRVYYFEEYLDALNDSENLSWAYNSKEKQFVICASGYVIVVSSNWEIVSVTTTNSTESTMKTCVVNVVYNTGKTIETPPDEEDCWTKVETDIA